MKIMFVSTRYRPNEVGGAEETVRLLAEGVVRAGDRAVVVSLAPDGVPQERVINGVHVYYVPLFNVFFPHQSKRQSAWRKVLWQVVEAWNPVMAARLGRIADREAPDLIHIHNTLGFTCAIWPALARRGLPMLQTLHDHYAACTNSVMYRSNINCARRCLRCRVFCWPRVRLSRHVDGLTSVSARLWQRIGPVGLFRGRNLTRVIHNCNADPPVALPNSGPRPGQPLRIGFLGRLEPIKGAHVLLEAARRIGAERVRVHIGGTGPAQYERDLKAQFGPPLVTFLGRVAPAAFFQRVDILVAPSLLEEASPRVVHEAYGFGVPVIGVTAGGMAELIREGCTGYFVPPGDITALETLLRRLLDDPPDWAALSAASLREAERFTFDRIFGEYSAAWQDVLRTHPTASKHRAIRGSGRAMPTPRIDDARTAPP
jgi:glycosyltransferase involved in cell wall biosynthesis